jgi:hypothetical protein
MSPFEAKGDAMFYCVGATLLLLFLAFMFWSRKKSWWKDACKFLAGAFFVSAGTTLYFYLVRTPVPVLGLNFTITPEANGIRSIVHFALFLAFFYLGFVRKATK